MSVGSVYPVRVEATLDARLSRWLWLVKWLLAIPHYVVLFFLWVAFVVVSVVAFFAILVGGRYPPTLFEFNVGVLRWSWRVAYYSYGALGTDRYPPFTLAEVADYPAHLEIDHPEHLSRGLVLVKWWLLAIPQYLVVGIFAGGGAWVALQADRTASGWGSGGLIGLLVLIAAVTLTVTGRYPRQLFDFVLGLNRWVLRVAAYAALMTDRYPPFELDLGGHETFTTTTVPTPAGPAPAGPPPPGLQAAAPAATAWAPEPPPPGQPPPPRRGWTALRVVSLLLGCLMGLVSVGLLAGGGVATWLDNSHRDATGYVSSGTYTFATASYALTGNWSDLGTSGTVAPSAILGTVRLRVTATDPTEAVFVGIAPRALADRYLAGVERAVVTNWTGGVADERQLAGGAPAVAPTDATIWVASVAGRGTQTLTWRPAHGDWTVVVMRADGVAGLAVSADAGATIPWLGWIAGGLIAAGALLLAGAVLLVVLAVVRASRRVTPVPGRS